MPPRKGKDDKAPAPKRRPRLTATARAQAQRDAFARRVHRSAQRVLAMTPVPKNAAVQERTVEDSAFPMNAWMAHVKEHPIKGVNRVTGLPY